MAKSFSFKMVTPDGKMVQKQVDLVQVKTLDGVIGILKNHTPLEAILDIAPLNLTIGGTKEIYAVGGGILHVKKDGVLLLADSFESDSEIDVERAKASKMRAENRLSQTENIDIKRAEVSLKKAINRIQVALKK